MSGSIFDRLSIDRSVSRWEERIGDLTPVEEVAGVRFKREDRFAPLGYGGINGAKLRQCVWLLSSYAASARGRRGMLSAASVKSPQLSMGTAVALHYGLPTVLVIGGKPQTAFNHENVAIARRLGAEFVFSPVAYNPVLQKAVRDLGEREEFRGYFTLEYGITVDGDDERVEAFHRLGAQQVANVPDDVVDLYVPAGSCNSVTSVLYGLALRPPPRLRRVVLFGIGPTRLDFIERRLAAIERVTGVQVRALFSRRYHHAPDLAAVHEPTGPTRWVLEHYDLHATKFADYQDEMPFRLGDVDFHPTYEGKVLSYMRLRPQQFRDFWLGGRSLFWIIGSRPSWAAMAPALGAA